MLTGIQSVILTCLLGPEDTGAFQRECGRLKQARRRATSEACRAYEKEYAKERRADPEEREKARAYREANAAGLSAYQKEYSKKRRADPVKIARDKAYAEAHKEESRAASRRCQRRRRADPIIYEKMLSDAKVWAASNPEKSRKSQQVARAKQFVRDPAAKLAHTLRARLRAALKKGTKISSSSVLLGCSILQWKKYLESLFKSGMTWGNHGSVWHIDHVKPCAVFDLTDSEQQKICFHWSNTQPLFAAENIAKGDKYVG